MPVFGAETGIFIRTLSFFQKLACLIFFFKLIDNISLSYINFPARLFCASAEKLINFSATKINF